MTILILVLVLLLVSLLLSNLISVYSSLSALEIKRLARAGDKSAKQLYKVLSFKSDALLVSWVVLATSLASIIVLSDAVGTALAILLALVILLVVHAVIPNIYLPFGNRLAETLAQPLGWLGSRLHPLTGRLSARLFDKPQPLHVYETVDLEKLIDHQTQRPDNRIDRSHLEMVKNGLSFNNLKVSDIMTPRSKVITARAGDHLGPVLLSELHKSGHLSFPVVEGKPEKIIGTLYLDDLNSVKDGGLVSQYMRQDVDFIDEDHPLKEVLHKLVAAKRHAYLVTNKFEETVGLITLSDIIDRIFPRPLAEELIIEDDLNDHLEQTELSREQDEPA